MMKKMLWLLPFMLACSSSSTSGGAASSDTCFAGSYNATFAQEASGDPNCPDLSAKTGVYTFSIDPSGEVITTLPQGATIVPGKFDESTCDATYGYTLANNDSACSDPLDHFSFDLVFDGRKSFKGTYTFKGCGTTGDAGPTVNVDCTYPVNGVTP